MRDLNLLPIDLSPNSTSAKSATLLKKIVIISAAIFLIISLTGGIAIFILKQSVASTIVEQNSLKNNIKSLEATEQTLFLMKDRIEKIKLAQEAKAVEGNFQQINKIVAGLPENVVINTVRIDSTKNEFSVVSKTSLDMATFLNSLVTSGVYKNLTLLGFSFSPELGYTITLSAF